MLLINGHPRDGGPRASGPPAPVATHAHDRRRIGDAVRALGLAG